MQHSKAWSPQNIFFKDVSAVNIYFSAGLLFSITYADITGYAKGDKIFNEFCMW